MGAIAYPPPRRRPLRALLQGPLGLSLTHDPGASGLVAGGCCHKACLCEPEGTRFDSLVRGDPPGILPLPLPTHAGQQHGGGQSYWGNNTVEANPTGATTRWRPILLGQQHGGGGGMRNWGHTRWGWGWGGYEELGAHTVGGWGWGGYEELGAHTVWGGYEELGAHTVRPENCFAGGRMAWAPGEGGGGASRNGLPCRALCFV